MALWCVGSYYSTKKSKERDERRHTYCRTHREAHINLPEDPIRCIRDLLLPKVQSYHATYTVCYHPTVYLVVR
jgi:hypothetical protein